MDLKAMGSKLKGLRETNHLSLEALSALSKVAKNTINQIELGQGNPTIGTLEAIAIKLDSKIEFDLLPKLNDRSLSPIPPEIWSGWRALKPEGKALCLYLVTDNDLYFDFLTEPFRSEVLKILQTLHLKMPK